MNEPDERPTVTVPLDDKKTVRGLVAEMRLFQRYKLRRFLGRGGMGVVWRAWDEKLERDVALKFLPDAVRADPEAVRELKRETKRCLDLTHPHIVRVHDFVEDAITAAIAMEFVDGRSLAAWKAAQPDGCVDPAELAPLLTQLCTALDHAHGQAHMVHRDLKPANVLVTADGTVKITDFGIARSLSETKTRLTGRAEGTSGTLGYMSPQQLMGEKPAVTDDIYALGATIYELLTSKPPFYSGEAYGIMMQVREKTAPPMAERRAELEIPAGSIPAAWEETVAACLAKEPEARPQSAGEVAARLELTAKGSTASPLAAGVGRVIPNAPRPTPKSKMPLYAGLAAVVALIVAAVIFWPKRATLPPGWSEVKDTVPPTQKVESQKPEIEPAPPSALAVLPREFTVTVDPPDVGAHLWLGPQSDVAVPAGGRAVVKDLPDGEHELIVQAEGYQPLTTRVTVKAGRGSVEAKLVAVKGAFTLKARAGTVVTAVDARGRETRVGSVPPGGTLSLDNLLTIGTYLFKFTHADCAEARQENVEVVLGRPAALAPAQVALPGELRIFSVPTGAEVAVNGQKLGATPATLKHQPSETALAVAVFARGYRRVEQTVTLKPKEVRTLNVGTLAAESGGIDFRFANAGFRLEQAKILIDGKAVVVAGAADPGPASARPATVIDGLEVGPRSVEITHPDYEPWKQTVSVRDQQNTPVVVQLKPKPGRLALRVSGPQSVSLFVNGRQLGPDDVRNGEVTLPAQEELALEVKAQGYKPAQRTVTLPANGADQWEVTLEKLRGPEAGQPWKNTLGMKFVPVPGTGALFCVWETRVQDFEAFVRATNHDATGGMYSNRGDGWKQQGDTWKSPGFPQGPTHPVVGVSQDDARAFCHWLTEKERGEGRLGPNQSYRLPTDAEWDVAVGPGQFPWGDQWPPPRGAGNYADESAKRGQFKSWSIIGSFIDGYDDGYDATAPAGSFTANRHGIFDLGGNVWEYVEDRSDGVRGASFNDDDRGALASSYRVGDSNDRNYYVGFRCVVAVGSAR